MNVVEWWIGLNGFDVGVIADQRVINNFEEIEFDKFRPSRHPFYRRGAN